MTSRFSHKRIIALKAELEALFLKLGYNVVYGKGVFKDGTCLVEAEKKVVINEYTPPDLQVEFMLNTLARMDLSNVFILPKIRELIETERAY